MEVKRVHVSHPKVINRLKRADGHLQSVVDMLQGGRPCLDIVQQLQAVESAIHAAKKTLIHEHIEHCSDAALHAKAKRQPPALDEFKTIAKYL